MPRTFGHDPRVTVSWCCQNKMLCVWLLILNWTTFPAALSTHATTQSGGTKPYIYYCRSPNMEIFTCWWHPVDHQDNVNYTLVYTTGDDAPRECPDYVSGGLNSCFFDALHTQIWEVYCMNVTAHTPAGRIISQKHCLDVADIVETDPPFNLSYTVLNGSVDESSRIIMVSWMYPIASQVREGWITLIYELRYKNLDQPEVWKVKERLREPHVELLDLPQGSYELMVRCRSTNSKHWSSWSNPLKIDISSRALTDRLLAFMLVTGIAVMALLIIGFGLIPQGKSIKALLLPQIPKPHIRGLDPLLIKKGKMEEINQHFSSFHDYEPPEYSLETWYQVSVDAGPVVKHYHQPDHVPLGAHLLVPELEEPEEPITITSSSSSPSSSEAVQTRPELVSCPGFDYSMIANPSAAPPGPQDFYTCVTSITSSGAVHLVPFLPDALKNIPYLQFKDQADVASLTEKQKQMVVQSTADVAAQLMPDQFAQQPLLAHPSDRN